MARPYLNQQIFLDRSKALYGDRYIYTNVIYVHSRQDVKIECRKHGPFLQKPYKHWGGYGCNECSNDLKRTPQDEFIRRCIEKHDGLYTYEKAEYKSLKDKITITCKDHGDFDQNAGNHCVSGYGCPKCSNNKGSLAILKVLTEFNIKSTAEKTIEGCKSKSALRFDFYLDDYNILIEYDGIGHYEEIGYFTSTSTLVANQERDEIKNKFCRENNIPLLRIPYWDLNNIPTILFKYLTEMGVIEELIT